MLNRTKFPFTALPIASAILLAAATFALGSVVHTPSDGRGYGPMTEIALK